LGFWDRLVGPGATVGENALVLTASVAGAAIAGARLAAAA
jgi:hypothetical protein